MNEDQMKAESGNDSEATIVSDSSSDPVLSDESEIAPKKEETLSSTSSSVINFPSATSSSSSCAVQQHPNDDDLEAALRESALGEGGIPFDLMELRDVVRTRLCRTNVILKLLSIMQSRSILFKHVYVHEDYEKSPLTYYLARIPSDCIRYVGLYVVWVYIPKLLVL